MEPFAAYGVISAEAQVKADWRNKFGTPGWLFFRKQACFWDSVLTKFQELIFAVLLSLPFLE
ncbi:MAG: hypothetical protein ACSLE0_14050, partial [Chitinophagaceae bacterium]